MMVDYTEFYDRLYPATDPCRHILWHHSRSVARLACHINEQLHLGIDPVQLETAAMLHDIGICGTNAAGLNCYGDRPYICHGVIGADIMREAGAPEWAARVAERHTGTGITPSLREILDLPLPADRNYMPETLMEKVICYADKFYSKSGDLKMKSLDRVRASMARHGGDTLSRFEDLHRAFSSALANYAG